MDTNTLLNAGLIVSIDDRSLVKMYFMVVLAAVTIMALHKIVK